jgi:hypothetical protein
MEARFLGSQKGYHRAKARDISKAYAALEAPLFHVASKSPNHLSVFCELLNRLNATKKQTARRHETCGPSGGLFGIDQEVVTLRGLSRRLPGLGSAQG